MINLEDGTLRVGDTISLKHEETGAEMEAFILDMFALEIKQEPRIFLVMATEDKTDSDSVFETFYLEYDTKRKLLVRILSQEFTDQIRAVYKEIQRVEAEQKNNKQ